MLNRELIIEKYNEQFGASLDAWDDNIIEGFVDLEVLGITDDMMLTCIEDKVFTQDSELLDPTLIRDHINGKGKKKSKKKTAKKTEVPAVDPNNPFGMFEQMINGVVLNQSAPMVEKMVSDCMNDWCDKNASKIQKKIEYIAPSGKTMDEITHRLFEEVTKVVQSNEPVLLVGPAGTGKNHLCKQIADFLGLEFYFANAVTQEHKLIGFIDANGVYHSTQFCTAFTNGGLFMFDEIDASDSQVLTTFNAALENGYMDFPTGRVYAHENFRVVACANTFGTGASYEYTGRTQLDAATLDRFAPIYIDYDERIENAMTDDTDLLTFIRCFRSACNDYGINHIASYRAIRRCSKFADALGIVESLKIGLLKNLEQDDMNMLVSKFTGKSDRWSLAFCDIASGC